MGCVKYPYDMEINFVLKILNLLSGNIGKNRNKDDQKWAGYQH